MSVYEHLYLGDEAGQRATIWADEWKELPPANTKFPSPGPGADTRLCGSMKERSVDAVLKQTDLFLGIMSVHSAIRNVFPKQLTSDQIKIIRRTPRCEPFAYYLDAIERELQSQGTPQQRRRLVRAQPIQIRSVVLGNDGRGGAVSLNLVSGQVVKFRLGNSVPASSSDRTPYGFAYKEVPASQTGQNLGLVMVVADTRSVGSGTDYVSTEPCTITERETICRDTHGPGRPRCEEVEITRSGVREVRSRSNPDYTTYALVLKKASGEAVAEINFELYDPNTSRDTGNCMSTGSHGSRF